MNKTISFFNDNIIMARPSNRIYSGTNALKLWRIILLLLLLTHILLPSFSLSLWHTLCMQMRATHAYIVNGATEFLFFFIFFSLFFFSYTCTRMPREWKKNFKKEKVQLSLFWSTYTTPPPLLPVIELSPLSLYLYLLFNLFSTLTDVYTMLYYTLPLPTYLNIQLARVCLFLFFRRFLENTHTIL